MPIIRTYGSSALMELAAAAGTSVGRAQAAEQSRAALLAGANIGAAAARQALAIDADERSQERNREFAREQQDRADELRREEDAQRAGIADRELSLRQQEADQRGAYQKALLEDRDADRTIRKQQARAGVIKAGTDSFARGLKSLTEAQEAAAKRRAAREASKTLLQGIDSEFTDPITGRVDENDALLHIARAEALRDGKLSKETFEALPSIRKAGGQKYQKLPADVQALYPVALASPMQAMKVAAQSAEPGDPASGPSTTAVQMLSAIASIKHDPRFDPALNPDAFTDLVSVRDRYAAAGAGPDILADMDMTIGQMRQTRERTLYPAVLTRAAQDADDMATGPVPGKLTPEYWQRYTASLRAHCQAAGITAEEIRPYLQRELAQRQAAAAAAFSPPPVQAAPSGPSPRVLEPVPIE